MLLCKSATIVCMVATLLLAIPIMTSAQATASDASVNPTCVATDQFGGQSCTCPSGYTLQNYGGSPICTNSDVAARDAQNQNPSCTQVWHLLNPICWGRIIGGVISTIAIGISGFLLGIAGLLFNWTIQNLVIDFNAFVYGGVRSGIEVAWGAFRDIANIIIIGMFTFVAISMILGLQQFGNRKLIARVLIVAVLINFSLLFARAIIETSHFIAGQFYKAAQSQINVAGTSGTTQASTGQALLNLSQNGLAGQFIQLMGVPTALDSDEFTLKLSQKLNSGWLALLYGLLTAAFLLGATLVFLYAVFILIVRTILLIFLLMTSSLAFASWLVPAFGAEKGWGMWWQSLLKSAVLAPLLLMFLWATLVIGKAFIASGGGSLGTLLSDPTAGSSIKALFFYLFMIGMFYASIKIASSFSSSIAGFGYAAMATKLAGGIPLALGARTLGFAGRNLIGRGGAIYAKQAGDESAEAQKKYRRERASLAPGDRAGAALLRNKLQDRLAEIDAKKRSGEALANRSFRFAGTNVGDTIFKRLGVPGYVAGGKVDSFAKRADKIAEDASKRAAAISKLDEKEAAAIRERAAREAGDGHRDRGRDLAANVEKTRADRDANKNALESATEIRKQVAKEMAEIAKQKAALPSGEASGAQQQQHDRALAEKQEALNKQDDIIERARNTVSKLDTDFAEAAKTLKEHDDKLKGVITEAGDAAVKAAKDDMQEIGRGLAGTIASRRPNFAPLGKKPDNDYIANLARSTFGKKQSDSGQREESLRSLLKEFRPEGGDAGGTTPKT